MKRKIIEMKKRTTFDPKQLISHLSHHKRDLMMLFSARKSI